MASEKPKDRKTKKAGLPRKDRRNAAAERPRDRARSQEMLAPSKLDLLITIVERRRSEYYMDLIQSYGANLQFVTKARKPGSGLAGTLGLNDTEYSAIFSVIRNDVSEKLAEALDKRLRSAKYGGGEAYTVPFSSVIGKTVYGFLASDSWVIGGESDE